ncbi:UBP1-associated proteins 1A-like isoform X2 [Durio zibethinus]|uniref:UBP1-associated proteins 1A-like isoform X1 n=1 Tax=Durio zibethinus TaxID=66656 RepID=A0A6P5YLW0_DURZI|nr:UBP1-associated proteins 1A-like isoform X1 [Durio zibethinus]XP_022741265.1 UBP1-associated proteins 1A-like isoform X2 [Durio zibethinus]
MVKVQKSKRQKLSNKKIKKTLMKIKDKSNRSETPQNPIVSEPEPEPEPGSSDSDFDTENLPELLETYTRDQLINLISEAARENSSFLSFVCRHADRDTSHRKLFVHGLAWETTRESLASAFERFGEIEDCNVIVEKATGKCKGYGFVLFKKRISASKALKDPKKKIHNRMTSCQLASVGSTSAAKDSDQTHPKKLADVKSINAVEPGVLFPPQPQQQSQVLAALAATQNFPLLGHTNPIYGSLLGSQINPVTTAGATSKMAVTAVPTVPTSHVGVVGGGFGRANSSLRGHYGTGQGLQSLYPNMQIGQQSGAGRGQGTSTNRAYSGYPSYI